MPKTPFQFYLEVFMQYLLSKDAINDSDSPNCFLGLIEYKIRYEWSSIKDVYYSSILKCMNFIADNQEYFDADIYIYGSFDNKVKEIKELVKNMH